MFCLIRELSKALRFYRQESAFCEGVTFNQFSILDLVVENGELRLAHVHELLAIEKSTTTRLVTPLVERGLLIKTTSPRDSRAVILQITEAGRETHQRVWHCASELLESVINTIPEGDRQTVLDALFTFVHACNHCCTNDNQQDPIVRKRKGGSR